MTPRQGPAAEIVARARRMVERAVPGVLAFGLILQAGACDRCSGGGDGSGQPAPQQSQPPVPAPAGLLAQLALPRPAASLAELREAMGGPMLMLPRTVGGLIANVLDMRIEMAEQFDERLPLVGAARRASADGSDGARLQYAVAIHVKSSTRFIHQLTAPHDARFSAQDGSSPGLTLLKPKAGADGPRLDAAVGVLGSYLIIGNDDAAVRQLGPYLTRTLARRTAPANDLVVELRPGLGRALKQPLDTLESWARSWSVITELPALLDLHSWFAAARSWSQRLGGGRLSVDLDPSTLTLTLDMTPLDEATRRQLGELPTVSLSGFARLPDDTLGAIAWAQAAATRHHQADSWAARAAALLPAADDGATRRALAKVLAALEKGRADAAMVGVRCTGVGITGFALGEARDAKVLADGLDGLTALAELGAVRKALAKRALLAQRATPRLARFPHPTWRVRLTPAPAGDEASGPGRPEIDLLGSVGDGHYWAAAGLQTVDTLRRLLTPKPDETWAARSALRKTLGRLAQRAWVAIVADAQAIHGCRLGKPGGGMVVPVALSAGMSHRGGARLYLEVARPLLRLAGRALDRP